jgi:hypothetical protein
MDALREIAPTVEYWKILDLVVGRVVTSADQI